MNTVVGKPIPMRKTAVYARAAAAGYVEIVKASKQVRTIVLYKIIEV